MALQCPQCGCTDIPFNEEFENIGLCECAECGYQDLAEGFTEVDDE